MAQVKLIETEQPQQFKPVTIQITFETQEEVNALRNIAAWYKTTYRSIESLNDFRETSIESWQKISNEIYNTLNPLSSCA